MYLLLILLITPHELTFFTWSFQVSWFRAMRVTSGRVLPTRSCSWSTQQVADLLPSLLPLILTSTTYSFGDVIKMSEISLVDPFELSSWCQVISKLRRWCIGQSRQSEGFCGIPRNSIFFQSACFSVHVALTWVAIGKIRALNNWSLVALVTILSLQILLSLVVVTLAMGVFLLILSEQPLAFVISDPTYINFETGCFFHVGLLYVDQSTMISLVLFLLISRPHFLLVCSSFIMIVLSSSTEVAIISVPQVVYFLATDKYSIFPVL